ncbi:hypothetical protein [Mobilicoccus massiliensis]|uniref:hypothetical protein n=1 Tax=Mobilicoccus massiliensis TaxID=1522310 RepID=UPI0011443E31|nr:hypothetical protein [Mobilicoccus massiliensis]
MDATRRAGKSAWNPRLTVRVITDKHSLTDEREWDALGSEGVEMMQALADVEGEPVRLDAVAPSMGEHVLVNDAVRMMANLDVVGAIELWLESDHIVAHLFADALSDAIEWAAQRNH